MKKPTKTSIRASVVAGSIVLLAASQGAGAVEFTHQPPTGGAFDKVVLHNVAISGDTFSVAADVDEVLAHSFGLAPPHLLSNIGFWTHDTLTAVCARHLYIAHDFKSTTPFGPTENVHFN